jgi:vacuolar-type H+-ATPase subunit I/STV1
MILGVISMAIDSAVSADLGFLFIMFLVLSMGSLFATLVIEYRAHKIDGLMLAIDHILSLLSNTFSFGRLLAMNTIHFVLAFLPYLFLDMAFKGTSNHYVFDSHGDLLPISIHPLFSGEIIALIWVIAAIIGSLIVVPVETVFSTLQALRLNWVEFFGKFFKGKGIPFKPFSVVRTYTRVN